MQFARILISDGSEYDIPLQVVIEKLANKIAEEKTLELCPEGPRKDLNYDNVFNDQLAEVTVDLQCKVKGELLQMAAEQLTWKRDIAPFAVKVTKPPKVDLTEEWLTAVKVVVDR